MLRLLRVRVEAAGAIGHPRARLVVSNHVSWLDILVYARLEPFCFVAKSEIGSWPLVATMAAAQGTVLVDRARRRCIPAVNRAMAAHLAQGRSVLLFPEGTTLDGPQLGVFRTSHLACLHTDLSAGAVARVQGAAISYDDPRAAWVGDATLIPHLWAVLCGPPIRCRVSFGRCEPVSLTFDRKQLGPALRETVGLLKDRDGRAMRAEEVGLCADPA